MEAFFFHGRDIWPWRFVAAVVLFGRIVDSCSKNAHEVKREHKRFRFKSRQPLWIDMKIMKLCPAKLNPFKILSNAESTQSDYVKLFQETKRDPVNQHRNNHLCKGTIQTLSELLLDRKRWPFCKFIQEWKATIFRPSRKPFGTANGWMGP